MNCTLTVLLCLGLSLLPRKMVQAVGLFQPMLRAMPNNVVHIGCQVIIICEGPPDAQEFYLHKEGIPASQKLKIHQDNKENEFFISSIKSHDAGRYWCYYRSSAGISEHSDTLDLVVTGAYTSKLTILSQPSSLVTSGHYVTLQCSSYEKYDTFILMKEREKFFLLMASQNTNTETFQALFRVGPMYYNQRWRFTCYGYYQNSSWLWSVPSNLLELVVSGIFHKPNIWAEPGNLITMESPVTIWCEGTIETQIYVLHKEGSTEIWDKPNQMDQYKAKFTISSVTKLLAGRYHCYSYTSAGWSKRSDTLELVVTGAYVKPSLMAWNSPVVTVMRFGTLKCVSDKNYSGFTLTKQDQKTFTSINSEYLYAGNSPARFQVGPITSSQRWRYRCYGYYSYNPQVWSEGSDPLELLVSGTLEKPRMWADPGPVINRGNAVTIWCQGTMQTQIYFLHKEGSPAPLGQQTPHGSHNNVKFSITSVEMVHAGQYRCYCYNSAGWSEHSDTMELVVTGVYQAKPNLSALSSPVVMAGGNVILKCVSSMPYDCFLIIGEDQNFSRSLKSIHTGESHAVFVEIPVASSKPGPFRCYGYYKRNPHVLSEASNTLEIYVSGFSKKPSLLSHQGPVLAPGDKLTFLCYSDMSYDKYALSKEGESDVPQLSAWHTQAGESHSNFTLDSVNFSTGGQYRCYGSHNFSSQWSASSDPLDILIMGKLPVTPNLSAYPGTTVSSGEKVTLLCQSSTLVDNFLLFKEGTSDPYMHQISKLQDSQYGAEFSMSAVTSALVGTYRCFGSRSSSPYQLSNSSVPVEINVSGLAEYQKTLIGVSVGILLMLFLLALFLLLRLRHHNKCRKGVQTETNFQHPEGAEKPVTRDRSIPKRSSPAPAVQEEIFYATVKGTEIKDSMELNIMSQHEENHIKNLYAQVKHSRLRRAQPTSPPLMPKELLDSKERQAKADQARDHQDAVSEELHEVTYSQLSIITPKQKQLNLTALRKKSPT